MFQVGSARRWGSLQATVLALAGGLAGCAGDVDAGAGPDGAGPDGAGAPSCTEFEPADLETVSAGARVLASTQNDGFSFGPLAPSLLANESGVYWYEGDGSVFGARRGQSGVVGLRQGAAATGSDTRRQIVLGMAGDAERVFVADAYLETGAVDFFPVPDFQPPGRLLSIPTQGGEPTVVLELDDAVVTPIAVDGARLVVFLQGPSSAGFYALDPASSELERLPVQSQFFSGRRLDDTLYVPDSEYPPNLLRSGFDDAEPERVMPLENTYFYVGPGFVLTREERLIEPEYTREERLLLHEPSSGCSRALPGLGEAISIETAVDAEHVYWFSYRTYDSRVPLGDDGPDLKLVRASLATGALARLELSDVVFDGAASIVGQDADTLYVANAGALLAIEKP